MKSWMTELLVCVLAAGLWAGTGIFDAEWPPDTTAQGLRAYWRLDEISVQQGRVAQYKMNDNAASSTVTNEEGTDGTLEDGSNDYTSDHDVTGVTSTGFVRALEFDGCDDYIDTNQTFESTFQDSFTISAWVALDDGQPAILPFVLASLKSGDGGDAVAISVTSEGKINAYYESNGNEARALTDQAVFFDGANGWSHVVAAFGDEAQDLPGLAIYVNGEVVALDETYDGSLGTVCFGAFASGNNLLLGCGSTTAGQPQSGSFLDGRLDNVEIYSQALTAEEVSALYWLQDEDTATAAYTVRDYVGGFDGTASDPIDELYDESGQVASCFHLDGSDDMVNVADHNDLDFGADDDFSVAFWAKCDGTLATTQYPLSKMQRHSSESCTGWSFYATSSGVRFRTQTSTVDTIENAIDNTVDFDDGNWHHVVGVRKAGNEIVIHVDGQQWDTEPVAGGRDLTNAEPLRIGASFNGWNVFDGSIDNVMLFDYALSAEDANDLYCRGAGDKASDGVTWRHFEALRYAFWSTFVAGGEPDSGFDAPALSEFATGGTYEKSGGWEAGKILCTYNGEIYQNKTLRTPAQCATDNPSTDTTNWQKSVDPTEYDHYSAATDRHLLDASGNPVDADSLLPAQADPLSQTESTYYSAEDTIVFEATAVVWDVNDVLSHWDLRKTYINNAGDDYADVDQAYIARWEDKNNDTWNYSTDGYVAQMDDPLWGCNASAWEFILGRLDPNGYNWLLDTATPYIPDGWTDAESPAGDGDIQATWRRVPRGYLYAAFDGTADSASDTVIWPGTAGNPPGWDPNEYIGSGFRAPYSGTSLSSVLSQVASAYGGTVDTEALAREHTWGGIDPETATWSVADGDSGPGSSTCGSIASIPAVTVQGILCIDYKFAETWKREPGSTESPYNLYGRMQDIWPEGAGRWWPSSAAATEDVYDSLNAEYVGNPNSVDYEGLDYWPRFTPTADTWYMMGHYAYWSRHDRDDPNTEYTGWGMDEPGAYAYAFAAWPNRQSPSVDWNSISTAWNPAGMPVGRPATAKTEIGIKLTWPETWGQPSGGTRAGRLANKFNGQSWQVPGAADPNDAQEYVTELAMKTASVLDWWRFGHWEEGAWEYDEPDVLHRPWSIMWISSVLPWKIYDYDSDGYGGLTCWEVGMLRIKPGQGDSLFTIIVRFPRIIEDEEIDLPEWTPPHPLDPPDWSPILPGPLPNDLGFPHGPGSGRSAPHHRVKREPWTDPSDPPFWGLNYDNIIVNN